MTDKEFRKLSRADLIKIIYEMQKNEQALNEELAKAKEALAARNMQYNKAGSIAEAALGVNEIFSRAQKAADEYLAQVKYKASHQENIISDAEKEAAAIRNKAQYVANKMIEQAEREIAKRWSLFNQKVNDILDARKDLESIIKR